MHFMLFLVDFKLFSGLMLFSWMERVFRGLRGHSWALNPGSEVAYEDGCHVRKLETVAGGPEELCAHVEALV